MDVSNYYAIAYVAGNHVIQMHSAPHNAGPAASLSTGHPINQISRLTVPASGIFDTVGSYIGRFIHFLRSAALSGNDIAQSIDNIAKVKDNFKNRMSTSSGAQMGDDAEFQDALEESGSGMRKRRRYY